MYHGAKANYNVNLFPWASSPLALRGAIERVMNTPNGVNGYNLGKSHFKFPPRAATASFSSHIRKAVIRKLCK